MAETEKPKFKFPKALGACADLLFTLKAKRLAAQKAVDAIEVEEKALKEHLIQNLPKSEASGVAGKLARVTVTKKTIAQVKDWDKFYAYIAKTKQWELMQRRVSDTAILERWERKVKVPGVEPFQVPTISMNKL